LTGFDLNQCIVPGAATKERLYFSRTLGAAFGCPRGRAVTMTDQLPQADGRLSRLGGLAAALASIVFAMSGARSQAATISVIPGPESAIVSVEGQLINDDGDQFREKTKALGKAVVVLGGPGGSVKAGITIGHVIRMNRFHSVVLDRCASACALAWLGGSPRSVAPGARIGFHAAFDQTKQVTSAGNALIGAYLTNMRLRYKAVIYITQAAPSSMAWLTFAEAKEYGIDVTLIDQSSSLAAQLDRAVCQKEASDEANAACTRLIHRNPKNVNAFNLRGLLYSAKGQYDLALADLNEVIRLAPKDATAWNNRGFVYNNMGNYDGALADLDEAIRLNPNHALAHKNRGIAYEKKGDLENALAEYNLSVTLYPNNPPPEAVAGAKRVEQALAARPASGRPENALDMR
jgi:Flp pilus assembly protein TadD